MKDLGIGLIVVGVLALVGAFFIDTTVGTGASGYGVGSLDLPTRVVNLQKLQLQMMVWQGGLGAFVAGAILYAVGALTLRLEQSKVLEPVAQPQVERSGTTCAWCSQVMPAGQRPCAYSSEEEQRRLAPDIRNETCRATLAERGLLELP